MTLKTGKEAFYKQVAMSLSEASDFASIVMVENMLKLAQMGVVIYPPLPGFYNHPKSLEDMVDFIVMRVLDQFGFHLDLVKRWEGEISSPIKSA